MLFPHSITKFAFGVQKRPCFLTRILPATTARFNHSGSPTELVGARPANHLFVMSTDGLGKMSPIILGLMHTFEQHYKKVGFFRPIAPKGEKFGEDRHVEVVRSTFNLEDEISEMSAVSHDVAVDYWTDYKVDDLVDIILSKYDAYKAKHPFTLIEGASLKGYDPKISWELNTLIARAIGAPVLLVTDGSRYDRDNEEDALKDIYTRSLLASDVIVDELGLPLVGVIVNRSKAKDNAATSDKLKQMLSASHKKIPFLGMYPHDQFLASNRLNDVISRLNASHSFAKDHYPNDWLVSDIVVGSGGLDQLLNDLQKKNGALVVTSHDRTDIILGVVMAHLCGKLHNVSGIVLVSGNTPTTGVTEILQSITKLHPGKPILPVYTVSQDVYDTLREIKMIESNVYPTSKRKIKRSMELFDQNIATDVLVEGTEKPVQVKRSPQQFKHFLMKQARTNHKHIVLPEGSDARVLEAADEILRKGIAELTILGNKDDILRDAATMHLDLSGAHIIDIKESPYVQEFIDKLVKVRGHKGVTEVVAKDLVADPTYFATLMVECGHADGMVSGACHTTANTIRPALQIIKTNEGTSIASSVFFMCLDDDVLVYGDCALNPEPNAQQLAEIAVSSADTARAFGIDPHVAMLSYATGDSNRGPIIDKVRDATSIAQKARPEIPIYGPIQYDAAVNMSIAKKKLKQDGANVGGHANVLIFPDLNTGNNTYKAVQQSTGCIAMGPLIQGLKKPVNDLSRGATVQDIVVTVAMTAIQASFSTSFSEHDQAKENVE